MPEYDPGSVAEEPWLSDASQREAEALGLALSAYVEQRFSEARDDLRRKLQALRRRAREEQAALRSLDERGASDDAISTMGGNIDRLLARIGALTKDYEALSVRRTAALEILASRSEFDIAEVVAEAERILRERP
ncbi:MAG TPA: hypothetical protein QGF05_02390 [Dehalococcoidia bacterium]|nr:hypothetical protein [Dehalococcoidia bacterium]